MSQSTSNSNSGTNSGIAEQLRTPAQSCAQCVKFGTECLLHAGKSVACARCQSRKEKRQFAELQCTGHIPSSAKGKARATCQVPEFRRGPMGPVKTIAYVK
ncbi:hypothetical protein B0H10DRAFT_1965206 [Mycena sp. CBHHK59/15]|nr:hypothetical protein B0H10DRAFT_1965206 [Mycena sp. CBHHK59/15]